MTAATPHALPVQDPHGSSGPSAVSPGPATEHDDVVVGVDGSSSTGTTLQRAVREAQTGRRHLHLVHAWSTPVWLGDGLSDSHRALRSPADNARAADQLVQTLLTERATRQADPTSRDGVGITAEATEGEPGRVLVRACRGAALVVLGGSGHGGPAATTVGSATAYVLLHASCPVLVVPPGGASSGAFARVVVGLDGLAGSGSALLWAADAARRHDCPLVVVHAWSTTPRRGSASVTRPTAGDPTTDDQATAKHAGLERQVAVLLPTPPTHTQLHVRPGEATRVLLDETGPQDLLVLGYRGSGSLTDPGMGSVATQCVEWSRVPVAVVREGQERPTHRLSLLSDPRRPGVSQY